NGQRLAKSFHLHPSNYWARQQLGCYWYERLGREELGACHFITLPSNLTTKGQQSPDSAASSAKFSSLCGRRGGAGESARTGCRNCRVQAHNLLISCRPFAGNCDGCRRSSHHPHYRANELADFA